MGIELELGFLLGVIALGTSLFAVFEVETAKWRKLLKWAIVIFGTLGLYSLVGHWALVFPGFAMVLGTTVHFIWCSKHGIHPIHATPRKKYYELRGWAWVE